MEIILSPDSINVICPKIQNDRYIFTMLVDALINKITRRNAMIQFSKPIIVHGIKNVNKINFIEKIIKCYLLVQNSSLTKNVRQMGWSIQDFINFQLKPNQTQWKDLKIYLRYENKRLGLIADPEFLIISWCIKFENYDVNANALLPSFPSDFNNQLLTPTEIKDVIEMWILKHMILKKLSYSIVRNSFQKLAPVLYDFVYTTDGYEILSLVYNMHMLIKTDRDQPMDMRLKLLKMYEPLFRKFINLGYYGANRVGFLFYGFPHPMFRPELIMTVFILNNYIFKPYTNDLEMTKFLTNNKKFLTNNTIQNFIKIKEEFKKFQSTYFFEIIDYDPKLKQNKLIQVYFKFYPKDKKISNYLNDVQSIFYGYPIFDILPNGSINGKNLFSISELSKIQYILPFNTKS